ncbi:MAG: hypothetical protein GX267_06720 [Fibrobacter sp.]|nr:hypothetical protein [Fibrobacter sp.]
MLVVFLNGSVFANYETIKVSHNVNQVTVLSSTDSGCIIEIQLGTFHRKSININGDEYNLLDLPIGSLILEKGNPELPKISRSITIPHGKCISYNIVEQKYESYSMKVAPSKGLLMRGDDQEGVEYTFGQIYKEDKFYPENMLEVGEPYLIRDLRGVRINFFPFSYNPLSGTLKVYTKMVIEFKYTGQSRANSYEKDRYESNRFFEPILRNHFLNYAQQKSNKRAVADAGKMLVIAYNDFVDEMQPFVLHKNSIGLNTELVSMDSIGTTAADVKNFIQNYYDNDNSLTFVLLVGDNAQIPTFIVSGGGSDPTYSLVSGSDNYPDIIIGRFSAETDDQVITMVQRSINYNKEDPSFHNAIGIASSSGAGDDGEYDWEHMRNIRTDLLNWHYVHVDEFYEGSRGGADAPNNPTPDMIIASINNGVSLINYIGHGSNDKWATSGFSISDVNALSNDNKLPFIFSVGCLVGNFIDRTCFCEAWLRAKNNLTNNPTGAIGIYGSSVKQLFIPPMEAQDEFNRLLTTEQNATFGALCYNSSIAMIDKYGTSGETTFLTWQIFGDPSINVLPPAPIPQGNIKIQFMTYHPLALTNSVSVNLRIINTGTTDIDLASVTAKYFYTYEGAAQREETHVHWSGILPSGRDITSKVNATIESLDVNHILNISFDSDAGVLIPGEYVECQTRFNKLNWTNYDQSNDFSFSTFTNFWDWQKVAGFINNSLIWGTTP